MKTIPIAEMHDLAAEDGEPRVRFTIVVCNGETAMTLEHPGYLRWDDFEGDDALAPLRRFVEGSRRERASAEGK